MPNLFLNFSFSGLSIRVAGTPEKPLFVAVDIARALGYSQPARQISPRLSFP